MMQEEEVHTISIEEAVLTGGYVGPTQGISMRPMLKQGRDSIVVRAKEGRLKPLDVALYRRGNDYVLHRVIALTDSGYLIRGDNTYSDELIEESKVFGVLTEYFRKNKRISVTDKRYLRYVRRRVKTYPVRRVYVRFKSAVKRFLKKLFGRKSLKR